MRPSFLGLILTGLLNLVAVILVAVNFNAIPAVMFIKIILLFCISIGIHSMLHFQEELYYGFNPLEGRWSADGEPEAEADA